MADTEQGRKDQALAAFRAKLLQHKARPPVAVSLCLGDP
jgi:hypothetical protein